MYKFIALSGVLIVILTVYSLNIKSDSISEKIYITKLESAELSVKSDYYLEKTRSLQELIDTSIKEKNGVFQEANNKLLIRYSDKEVKELMSEISNNILKMKLAVVRIEAATKRIKALNHELLIGLYLSIFYSLIGVILSFLGFYMWYIKVQRVLDIQINNNISKT